MQVAKMMVNEQVSAFR